MRGALPPPLPTKERYLLVFLAFTEVILSRILGKSMKTEWYWETLKPFELSAEEITLLYKDALRRRSEKITSCVTTTAQLQPEAQQTLLAGQTVRTRVPRVNCNPHATETALLNSEATQLSLKGQYWLNWKPEAISDSMPVFDGSIIHEMHNLDTTVFHIEYGKDGSTIRSVILELLFSSRQSSFSLNYAWS